MKNILFAASIILAAAISTAETAADSLSDLAFLKDFCGTMPQDDTCMAKFVAMPKDEQMLVYIVSAARIVYAEGINDMQKGVTRPKRAAAICKLLPHGPVSGWTGKISTLSTNGDGKGVVAIEIAPDVHVMTYNNSFSDDVGGWETLIAPSSPVYRKALSLSVGQSVKFSGLLFGSDVDCLKELSMTLEGSIKQPDFLMRFSDIGAD
jgi:hypothetical protein